MILQPVLTKAGIKAMRDAAIDGNPPLRFQSLSVGSGRWPEPPSAEVESLKNQEDRVRIAEVTAHASDLLHIQAMLQTEKDFDICEVGLHLVSGDLFAIYADKSPILSKAKSVPILIAFDVVLRGLPSERIEVTAPSNQTGVMFAPELLKVAESIGNLTRMLADSIYSVERMSGRVEEFERRIRDLERRVQ